MNRSFVQGTPIVLCAINARFAHTSFGLRYLRAQLGPELHAQTQIAEYTISQNARDIVEALLRLGPDGKPPSIIGIGVYIWNTDKVLEVLQLLRLVAPATLVVLGGPEISHETSGQRHVEWCDAILCGEADLEFKRLLSTLYSDGVMSVSGEGLRKKLLGEGARPLILKCEEPEFATLAFPYREYTDSDIAHRVLYVEASRGCPYKCEYCLSSLDKGVRNFGIEPFLAEMSLLMERGARQFKFVDRTFNLSPKISTRILEFFYLKSQQYDLFMHFELVPDRLPEELKEWITKFKKGALQFEIGVQTWNKQVTARISRRQDYVKIVDNIQYLSKFTGVHMHTDLIAGLPGESLESFAQGFDALLAAGAQEIQVGILKRLKGTPIVRHDEEYGMVYQPFSPFQILKNHALSFEEINQIARFSSYWDALGNSGQFATSMELWKKTLSARGKSFFWAFFELSEFLFRRFGATHSIALLNLLEQFWVYLQKKENADPALIEAFRAALIQDYAHGPQKRDTPRFLGSGTHVGQRSESFKASDKASGKASGNASEQGVDKKLPKRQEQHAYRR